MSSNNNKRKDVYVEENGRTSNNNQKRLATGEVSDRQANEALPEVIIIEDGDDEREASSGTVAVTSRSTSTTATTTTVACNCRDTMLVEFQCQVCHDVVHKAHGLACSHLFCEYCIKRWLSTKITCPVCRGYARDAYPIPSIDLVVSKVMANASEAEKAERAKNAAERQQGMYSIKQSVPLMAELGPHHHGPSSYNQFNHLMTQIRSSMRDHHHRNGGGQPPAIPFLPQLRVSPAYISPPMGPHGPQSAVINHHHVQVVPSMADHHLHHHHFNPHP